MIKRWFALSQQLLSEAISQTLLSTGLLILRVGIGGLFLVHGWEKLSHFQEKSANFPDPLGVGSTLSLVLIIFAEVVCSLAVMTGLLTRIFCIPAIIAMFVAAFVIHAEDPWSRKEFALLYLIPFLTLMLTGPGRFSLDHLWWFRRKKNPEF